MGCQQIFVMSQICMQKHSHEFQEDLCTNKSTGIKIMTSLEAVIN